MAIFSIGIDLSEVDRIARLIDRYGERFVRRVFTEKEIAYCRPRANAAHSYAARFAAKEAVFKATGLGLSMGMSWRDVEVVNDHRGKPSVNLFGVAAQQLAGKKVHISITHAASYAIVMIVVEDKEEKSLFGAVD